MILHNAKLYIIQKPSMSLLGVKFLQKKLGKIYINKYIKIETSLLKSWSYLLALFHKNIEHYIESSLM